MKAPGRTGKTVVTLSDDWRAWVVDNLLAGKTETDIVSVLRAHKVVAKIAQREVRALACSPSLDACRRHAAVRRQAELVLQLLRTMQHMCPVPSSIERRNGVGADEFFARYLAASQPVVLGDVASKWPAVGRWTPAWLSEQLGDTEIEITDARDSDPNYDENYQKHTRRVLMRDFVARVQSAGVTNDFYLVANNNALNLRSFRTLLQDIVVPELYCDGVPEPGGASFWFGPAGTVTPLHHDTTSILFSQVYGRKRFELISPAETALLTRARGYYCPLDLDGPEMARSPWKDLQVRTVVLSPGDTLFLPAGWWHRVTALDVSLSLSLLNLRRLNGFDWYRPGFPLRETLVGKDGV